MSAERGPRFRLTALTILMSCLCMGRLWGAGTAELLKEYEKHLDQIEALQRKIAFEAWTVADCRQMMAHLEANQEVASRMRAMGTELNKTHPLIRRQNFLLENMHDFLDYCSIRTAMATKDGATKSAVMLLVGKTPLHKEFAGLNLVKVSDHDGTFAGLAEAEAKWWRQEMSRTYYGENWGRMTLTEIAEGEATLGRSTIAQFEDLAVNTAISPEMYRTYSGLKYVGAYVQEAHIVGEDGKYCKVRCAADSPLENEKDLRYALDELGYTVTPPDPLRKDVKCYTLVKEGHQPIIVYKSRADFCNAVNPHLERAGAGFRLEEKPPRFALGLVSDNDVQLRFNLEKVPAATDEELLRQGCSAEDLAIVRETPPEHASGLDKKLKDLKATRDTMIAEREAQVYVKYAKKNKFAMGSIGNEAEDAFLAYMERTAKKEPHRVPDVVNNYRRDVYNRAADAQCREYNRAFQEYQEACNRLPRDHPDLLRLKEYCAQIQTDTKGTLFNARRLQRSGSTLTPPQPNWLGGLFRGPEPYVLPDGPKNKHFQKFSTLAHDLGDELRLGRAVTPRVLDRRALLDYLKQHPGATVLQIGGNLFALWDTWKEFRSAKDPTRDLRWLDSLARAGTQFVIFDAVPMYFELTAGEAAAGLYNMVALGATVSAITFKCVGDYAVRRWQHVVVEKKLLNSFGGVTPDGKDANTEDFFNMLNDTLTQADLDAPNQVRLGEFENGKVFRGKDDEGSFVFRSLKPEYHERWDNGERAFLRYVPLRSGYNAFSDFGALWMANHYSEQKWDVQTVSPGQLIVARRLERAYDLLRAEYLRTRAEAAPEEYLTVYESPVYGRVENLYQGLSKGEFEYYTKRFNEAWATAGARMTTGFANHTEMEKQITQSAYRQFIEAMMRFADENHEACLAFDKAGPLEIQAWVSSDVPVKLNGRLWTTNELLAEMKKRRQSYATAWEKGRVDWLPEVRKRFKPQPPVAGLPKVSVVSFQAVRAAGAAPVRTMVERPNAGRGTPIYYGENTVLEFRYTVVDPGNKIMTLALEVDGKALGPMGMPGVRDEPAGKRWSEPGAHTTRFSATCDLDRVETTIVKILSKEQPDGPWVELARSGPVSVAAFPRGWALSEIARGSARDLAQRTTTGPTRGFSLRKVAALGIEQGVLRGRRVYTDRGLDSGKPFEVVETDDFSITGLPRLMVDGQTYRPVVRYAFSRTRTPDEGTRKIDSLSERFKIKVSGQTVTLPQDNRERLLTTKDFVEPAAAAQGIPLELTARPSGSSHDFSRWEMTVMLYEEVRFRLQPLQQTLTLRYTRLDEFQDGIPIAWSGEADPALTTDVGDGRPRADADPGTPTGRDTNRGGGTTAGGGSGERVPGYVTAFGDGTGRPRSDADTTVAGGTPVSRERVPAHTGSHGDGSARPPVPVAPPPDPTAVLRSAKPWLDPQVQQLMNEWLHTSTPYAANYRGDLRWTDWAVALSPGAIAAGPPDHPQGMTREEYLFTYSPKLRSRRHYTLREYLERRLRGESGVQASVPDEASHPAPPTPPGPPAPPAPAVGSTVGKAAPEIEGRLAGGTGPQFKLSTLKGKAVILLFGVGYDPFAVSGARRLAEAQRSVPAGRMASVVVLMDAPSARRDVAAEAAKFRVPQECLPEVDLKKTAADYGLTSAGGAANCSLLVLDRNGVIRYRTDRDLLVSLRSPEFIKVMRGLLPEADWAALLEPRTKK